MFFEHMSQDQAARAVTSGALVLLGLLQILKPGCFWGLSIYFKGTRASLNPEQCDRLARVLDARQRAEGDANAFMRYAGIFTIAMAALVQVPDLPYVMPYALTCLATAAAILASYLRFRRATELRVAPLVPRSPWRSLPPLAIAATAICLLGAGAFAVYPQFRLGSIIVIIAAIGLLGVAWRVAIAPAMLFGNDSQLEYLVDEHLRFARAMNLVALACAPPTVLVLLAGATLPLRAFFFDGVQLAVLVAFLVALLLSFIPTRKRISIA
jgi:hypothetical protein